MSSRNLTQEQQRMVEIWERHTTAEFKEKNIDATIATMASDPFVNHVPVMIGGVAIVKLSTSTRHISSLVIHQTLKSYQWLARLEKIA